MRLLRLLSWTALLVLLVFTAASYAGLPDSMPTHMGLDGKVTSVAAKSLWGWFLLPGIALALQLLFEGIGVMLPSRPQWFNFPEKDRFLQLPPEYQAPVIAQMRTMLDITQLGMLLLFGVLQVQMWMAAQGRGTSGLFISALVLPVLLTPAALFWLTRITAALEREEARFLASQATPTQRGQPSR